MPCNRPFSEMAVLRRAILRDASRMDVLKDARRTPRRTLAKLSKQSRRSSTWPAIAASAAGVRRRGWQQHPHQSGEVGHLAAETSVRKNCGEGLTSSSKAPISASKEKSLRDCEGGELANPDITSYWRRPGPRSTPKEAMLKSGEDGTRRALHGNALR